MHGILYKISSPTILKSSQTERRVLLHCLHRKAKSCSIFRNRARKRIPARRTESARADLAKRLASSYARRSKSRKPILQSRLYSAARKKRISTSHSPTRVTCNWACGLCYRWRTPNHPCGRQDWPSLTPASGSAIASRSAFRRRQDFAYGDTFPHEADMDQLNGVDFRKGCFIGQEVVSRMQHKTVVRTRVPVAFGGTRRKKAPK